MLANLAKRIKHWLLEKIANGQAVVLNLEFIGTVELSNLSVIESNITCVRRHKGVVYHMRPAPMYYYVCTVPGRGDDTNDGLLDDMALATIEKAVSLADEKFGDRILILNESWRWHKPSELAYREEICVSD